MKALHKAKNDVYQKKPEKCFLIEKDLLTLTEVLLDFDLFKLAISPFISAKIESSVR